MVALFAYIIKSIVASGILYAWYHLALRNRKLHSYNRFYLLMSVVLSLALPLVNFRLYDLAPIISAPAAESPRPLSFATGYIILCSIGMVGFTLLVIMCSKISRVYRIKRRHGYSKLGGIDLIETPHPAAPFSFFNNLFWREDMSTIDDKGEKIFEHEMAHIRQKHTYDKLFMQTITCICWINPFCWLIQKELNMVHEFMADAAAIDEGDTGSFARMLLQSYSRGRYLDPAHYFFNSPVIRRLNMIAAPAVASYKYVRKLTVLPLAAILLTLFSFSFSAATSDLQPGTMQRSSPADTGPKVSMSCPARTFFIRHSYRTFI